MLSVSNGEIEDVENVMESALALMIDSWDLLTNYVRDFTSSNTGQIYLKASKPRSFL